MCVQLPPSVEYRTESSHADRGVGDASSPRPAHRVADNNGDVDAELGSQPLPQPGGGRVRVDGQQCEFVAGDVRAVHARGGEHEPLPGLDDPQIAPGGDHPHRFLVDRLASRLLTHIGVGGRQRDQPALDLRHGLGGHHQDVAVLQLWCRIGDGSNEIVTGPQIRHSRDRQDLEASRAVVGGREVRHRPAPRQRRPWRRSRRHPT